MGVTFTNPRTGDAHKLGFGPEALDAVAAHVAHGGTQPAQQLVHNAGQCAQIGELHHALDAGVMKPSDVVADLAAVISGHTPVAPADDDVVVFDSTGLAIQDVAAAGIVYRRARERGLGVAVELG